MSIAFCRMSILVSRSGWILIGRIGDEKSLVIRRDIQSEYVADSPPCAHSSFARNDCAHQFVRVQRALHQHLRFASSRQLHCLARSRRLSPMSMIGIVPRSICIFPRFRGSVPRGPQESGQSTVPECLKGSAERHLVARPRNRRPDRRLCCGACDQAQIVAIWVLHNQLRQRQRGPAQFCGRCKKLGCAGKDIRRPAPFFASQSYLIFFVAVIFRYHPHLRENAVSDMDSVDRTRGRCSLMCSRAREYSC